MRGEKFWSSAQIARDLERSQEIIAWKYGNINSFGYGIWLCWTKQADFVVLLVGATCITQKDKYWIQTAHAGTGKLCLSWGKSVLES